MSAVRGSDLEDVVLMRQPPSDTSRPRIAHGVLSAGMAWLGPRSVDAYREAECRVRLGSPAECAMASDGCRHARC